MRSRANYADWWCLGGTSSLPGKAWVSQCGKQGNWYVAGLNALKEPLTLTLDLPMFAPGETIRYFVDEKDGSPTVYPLKIDKKGRAKVTIQPNGGMICKRF